jgi:hypothetical protein
MYIPMEPGEEMVLKVHRHWLFIVTRLVGLLVMLIAPLVVISVLRMLGVALFADITTPALVTLWALWGLVLWALFWQFWTTYYMDIWVITTKRIIDIDYLRLFDRNIAMLRFERVQDVTTHVQGIMGMLLKYGSVVVQTAGSDKEFVVTSCTRSNRSMAMLRSNSLR